MKGGEMNSVGSSTRQDIELDAERVDGFDLLVEEEAGAALLAESTTIGVLGEGVSGTARGGSLWQERGLSSRLEHAVLDDWGLHA